MAPYWEGKVEQSIWPSGKGASTPLVESEEETDGVGLGAAGGGLTFLSWTDGEIDDTGMGVSFEEVDAIVGVGVGVGLIVGATNVLETDTRVEVGYAEEAAEESPPLSAHTREPFLMPS